MTWDKRISVDIINEHLSIIIDGFPHLYLPMSNYDGFQSWKFKPGSTFLCIEYYRKGGPLVLTEYSDREIWETILKKLNKLFKIQCSQEEM